MIGSRTLLWDTARLLGVNTFARGVGIVALIAYARMLSPSDLAALPVFLILATFSTIPFSFGLYPTLIREVPKLLLEDESQALGMIRTVVLTVGGGVLIAAAAYWMLSPAIARAYFDAADSAWLVRWMAAGTIARGWDEVITFVLRATREYRLLASKKLVSELAQPLLAVPLTYVMGTRGLLLGLTTGLALGIIWAVWGTRRYIFRRTRSLPLGPLVRRSWPYYIEGFLFFLTQQGDQALVGALLAPPVLAAYYVARRIPDALGLILYSVEEVMGSTLARAAVDGTHAIARAFRTMALVLGVFVLPASALAASLAGAYVTLAGRVNYAFALPAIVVLALATIPQAGVTVTSQAALALGHPSDRLKITALFAGLLLAFTLISTRLGLNAVAIGRAMAIVLSATAGFWITRSFRPQLPWRDLGRFLLPTILLVVTTVGLDVIFGQQWLVPLCALAGCGVFAATAYFLLSPRQRAELGSWA